MSEQHHDPAGGRQATSLAPPEIKAASPGRLLGNGRLRTLVTPCGAGGTWFEALSLTRWRGDRLLDEDGEFVFVRDLDSRACWPIALRPAPLPAEHGEIDEGPAWFAITRERDGISARLETWVDAEHAMVCRRIHLINRSERSRHLELTTWHEIALDLPASFAAHPAFSKLFLETELARDAGLVFARRRPRSPKERHPWLAHGLWGPGALEVETRRVAFLGRGGDLERARGLRSLSPLSGTAGSVLDPVFVQRRRTALAPGERADYVSLLIATPTREEAIRIAGESWSAEACRRSRDTADARARSGWDELGLAHAEAMQAEREAVAEMYPDPHGDLDVPEPFERAAIAPRATESAETEAAPSLEPLRAFNGIGGFSADGSEYVLRLRRGPDGELCRPPMPWSNVLANEDFGCLVTEGGSISTWSVNSRTHRLTPWSNDPVRDPCSEALYLRDLERGVAWSPLPGPCPGPGDYEVRHRFGSTRFRHRTDGIETIADVFVPVVGHFRIARLRLTNRGTRTRRLAAVSFQRLELGERSEDRRTLATAFDPEHRVLTAWQPAGTGIDRLAFATAIVHGKAMATSHATDAAAFIGRGGSLRHPAAMARDEPLDGHTGAHPEPCFAWRVDLEVAPGQTRECAFILGDCENRDALGAVLESLRQPGEIARLEREVHDYWTDCVGRVQVETPVAALDLMVNGWLMYQTMACRLWGRTAFYQSGGAFGFRDQLQDATALLAVAPDLVRRQILLHAAHQFPEGDVLHWWHPPRSHGLRTRFVDDLLWLPDATATYVRATGDHDILNALVGFVAGRALTPGEDEAFLEPTMVGPSASVYEHCCLAIDRSLSTGDHGLPFFGTGDWNDGMNRVGREGRGESVWMAFFLFSVIEAFAPLCVERGDAERAARYREHQQRLQSAIETHAWDGAWYRRGYFDDGTPLGSQSSDECRIDALVQAWSVLSGAAPRERAEQAMDAVMRHLVSETGGIVKLLTPAFDRTPHDPGYIKGYVPGVRENGGQYTHAALWVVRALAQLGRTGDAARLLAMLSPVSHGSSAAGVETYSVEPYVIAADVYGELPHVGRGGWTWYTGSAGWMLRVALESLLGVTVEDGRTLVIRPSIPDSWPEYRVRLRPLGLGTTYSIVVRRGEAEGGAAVRGVLDGQPLKAQEDRVLVPLGADGVHHEVTVFIDSNLVNRR